MKSSSLLRAPAALLCVVLAIPARFASAALQQASGPNDRAAYAIPFEYDPLTAPYIVVRVSVNDSEPLPVIVDTGSNAPLLLSARTRKKLNLPLTGKTEQVWPGETVMREVAVKSVQLLVSGGTLALEGLSTALESHAPFFDEVYGKERIAGVIGVGLFGNVTARIDFSKKIITASASPTALLPSHGATKVPLEPRNGYCYLQVGLGRHISATLMLDTGANTTSVPADAAPQVEPLARDARMTGLMDGSIAVQDLLLLRSITLAGHSEPNVAADVAASGFPATLGLDVLSRFRVTLDIRNSVMYLARSSDYADHLRPAGRSGAYFTEVSGRFMVTHVEAG